MYCTLPPEKPGEGRARISFQDRSLSRRLRTDVDENPLATSETDVVEETGEVRAQPSDERRYGPRRLLACPVMMRFGNLEFPGTIRNASGGGLFVESLLLVETGEQGTVSLPGGEAIGCRVVWMRQFTHEEGPGIGLLFDGEDAAQEERARAWVTGILDKS